MIIIWPTYMIRPEIWLLFLNLNSDGFSSIMLIDSGATWIETCWTNFINFSKKLNVSQLCFVGFNFIIYPFIFDLFAGGSKVFWDRFIYEESFWWKCFRWTILFLQILTFFFTNWAKPWHCDDCATPGHSLIMELKELQWNHFFGDNDKQLAIVLFVIQIIWLCSSAIGFRLVDFFF